MFELKQLYNSDIPVTGSTVNTIKSGLLPNYDVHHVKHVSFCPFMPSNTVCLHLLVFLDGIDALVLVEGSGVDRWQLNRVALNQAVFMLDLSTQFLDRFLELFWGTALLQSDNKCFVIFVGHF